jgi:hypothetical protein
MKNKNVARILFINLLVIQLVIPFGVLAEVMPTYTQPSSSTYYGTYTPPPSDTTIQQQQTGTTTYQQPYQAPIVTDPASTTIINQYPYGKDALGMPIYPTTGDTPIGTGIIPYKAPDGI